MCSFLVTAWTVWNLTVVNTFLKGRGPDETTQVEHRGITFIHNLLHMTGERILQPFQDGDVLAVYNGEIYNSRAVPEGFDGRHLYRSDGECILPAYRSYGERFPQFLDGEWGITVVDFDRRLAILSTDVFGTKPLWYSIHDGFHSSSYESALLRLGLPAHSVQMVKPNCIMVFSLADPKTPRLIREFAVHEFDLRQFKNHTRDWQTAFERAVHKRTHEVLHPVFVGLSSGYDSGALHLALENVAMQHTVYYFTIAAREIPEILRGRLGNFNRSAARAWQLHLSFQDYLEEKRWLLDNSEPFQYSSDNWAGGTVQQDGAAPGLSHIFRQCRAAGILVYLSGAGADEIISDDGYQGEKFFPHSSFGGLFPEELHELFPWRSVFLGTQRDYLMKEEVIAGAHSLESRYPFLDRRVVQEYIWLTAEAKNAVYKRPVHDYLVAHAYPLDAGKKGGFAAGQHLTKQGKTRKEVLYDAMDPEAVVPLPPSLCPEFDEHPELEGDPRSIIVAYLSLTRDSSPDAHDQYSSYIARYNADGMLKFQNDTCDVARASYRVTMCFLLVYASQCFSLLDRDSQVWSLIARVSWWEIILSGWPLFTALYRLAANLPWDRHPSLAVDDTSASCETCAAVRLLEAVGCRPAPAAELAAANALAALTPGKENDAVIIIAQAELTTTYASLFHFLRSPGACWALSALHRLAMPYYRIHMTHAVWSSGLQNEVMSSGLEAQAYEAVSKELLPWEWD
eukprot:TRINITY_DN71693_c0_g1_i1.p1 TRINITY_DN71693_c0_g1~~TRINITY_DN71693_c0_g1_i1.p1  ORF type:complete len:737 (+),score=63.41 TRINITY_DN71693_c0_g1_i1:59-2269(+)